MRIADQTKRPLTVVVQQFFNEVDVGKDHSSAAVSLELELVKGITTMRVRRRKISKGGSRTPQ